jgi:hypothetical protein
VKGKGRPGVRRGSERRRNVGRPDPNTYRERFWEERLAGADTPRKKVYLLQNKMLADIEGLPSEHQDAARELAVIGLEDILDEIRIRVVEAARA